MGGGSGRGLSFGATVGSGELPLEYKIESGVMPKLAEIGAEGAALLPEEKTTPVLMVRYLGGACTEDLTVGRVYRVLAIELDLYRLTDDTGEDNLYPQKYFEVESMDERASPMSV